MSKGLPQLSQNPDQELTANGKNSIRLWLRITEQKGRSMACTRRNNPRTIGTLLAGAKRRLGTYGSYLDGHGKSLDH